MIIQTILLDPSEAVWTDGVSHLSSLDPSGAILADAEHPTRNRKVLLESDRDFKHEGYRLGLGAHGGSGSRPASA